MGTEQANKKYLHQSAKVFMRNGDYAGAGQLLRQAIEGDQPFIGAFIDLAFCYYSVGRMDAFSRTIRTAEQEFERSRGFLSIEEQERSLLALGKLVEESGRLFEALQLYREGFHLAVKTESERSVIFQAQELRLRNAIGHGDEKADLYQNCLAVRTSRADWHFELEHALLLTEARILKIENLITELDRLRRQVAHPDDFTLVVYDCLEILFKMGELPQQMRDWYADQNLQPKDAYERVIHSLTAGIKVDFSSWKELSRELSPFGQIRVLQILKAQRRDQEFDWQLLKLLNSLSDQNRKLLTTVPTAASGQEISFDPVQGVLRFGAHELRLSSGSFEWTYLNLFTDKSEISTERALQQLYQEEWNEAGFQRLRIALHRFNQKCAKHLGLPKVFALRKTRAQILMPVRRNPIGVTVVRPCARHVTLVTACESRRRLTLAPRRSTRRRLPTSDSARESKSHPPRFRNGH